MNLMAIFKTMDPIKRYVSFLLITTTVTLLIIFLVLYVNLVLSDRNETLIADFHEPTLYKLAKIGDNAQEMKSLIFQESFRLHLSEERKQDKTLPNPERDYAFDFDTHIVKIREYIGHIQSIQNEFGDSRYAALVAKLTANEQYLKVKTFDSIIDNISQSNWSVYLDGLLINAKQLEILHSHSLENLRKKIIEQNRRKFTHIFLIFPVVLIIGGFFVYRLFKLINMSLFRRQQSEEGMRVLNDELEVRIEERTRENKLLLDAAGEGIYGVDLDGSCTFSNPAGAKMLGYKVEDLIGHDLHNLLHHTKADGSPYRRTESHIYAAFMDGEVHTVDDEVFWRKDGRSFPVEYISTPIFEEGETTGAVVVFRDISERQKAEQALKEVHQLNNTIFAGSPVGIGIYDKSGQCISANEAYADIVGATRKQVMAQNYNHLDSWKESGLFGKAQECQTRGEMTRYELHMRSTFGKEIYVDCHLVPLTVNEERHLLLMANDMTENRNMQAQLIQSSKMATLGEMATGVAHELNQPLNIIRMAIHNIQRKSENNKAGPEYLIRKLGKIGNQIERASAIIDHMRIFGRKPDATPVLLDPKLMIDSVLGLIGAQLRLAEIEVTMEAPEKSSPVLGHQVQIEQVLLNLIGNARDSLNSKENDNKRIRVDITENAGSILISVEDTGGGIDDNALPRIFEPFFTTKEIGAGTGLGLSISYGIIIDMGGTITAENTDNGARFIIALPAGNEEAQPAQNAS